MNQPDLGTDIELDKTQDRVINTSTAKVILENTSCWGVLAAIFIIMILVLQNDMKVSFHSMVAGGWQNRHKQLD